MGKFLRRMARSWLVSGVLISALWCGVSPTVWSGGAIQQAEDPIHVFFEEPGDEVEGAASKHLVFLREGGLSRPQPVRVRFRVSAPTVPDAQVSRTGLVRPARDGFDFVAVTGELEFEPGVTERSVEVRLIDDFVPDGPRAVQVVFQRIDGSAGPEVTRQFIIEDDEREMLEQSIYLEEYPVYGAVSIPDPAGGVIRFSGYDLIRLQPDGLPDTSFGGRAGIVRLPPYPLIETTVSPYGVAVDAHQNVTVCASLSSLDEFLIWNSKIKTGVEPGLTNGWRHISGRSAGRPRPLSDGGILIPIERNGNAFLLRVESEAGLRVAFSMAGTLVHVFPNDSFLLAEIVSGREQVLRRYGADGTIDSRFTPIAEVPSGALLHFDDADRIYVVESFAELEGLSKVRVRRHHHDGTVDASFDALAQALTRDGIDGLKVAPNGEVVGWVGSTLVRYGEDGSRVNQLLPDPNQPSLGGVEYNWIPLNDGQIALTFRRCESTGWGGSSVCWRVAEAFARVDGTLVGRSGKGVTPALLGRGELWGDAERELFRRRIPSSLPEVGFPITGSHVLEQAVRLRIQRSGPTSKEAIVRGRVWEWRGRQWIERKDLPLDVTFPVGRSEIEAEWPGVAQPGRQGLRLFLVRLESATGADLSSFTACRLWVWDPDALPQLGTLTLEYPDAEGPNAQGISLGRLREGQKLQTADDAVGPWLPWDPEFLSFAEPFPGISLWHWGETAVPRRFFRLR